MASKKSREKILATLARLKVPLEDSTLKNATYNTAEPSPMHISSCLTCVGEFCCDHHKRPKTKTKTWRERATQQTWYSQPTQLASQHYRKTSLRVYILSADFIKEKSFDERNLRLIQSKKLRNISALFEESKNSRKVFHSVTGAVLEERIDIRASFR